MQGCLGLCLHNPITEVTRSLNTLNAAVEHRTAYKVISIKAIYGVCVQMTLPSRSEYFSSCKKETLDKVDSNSSFVLISVFENDHFTLSMTQTTTDTTD